jgi:hypothetical protein
VTEHALRATRTRRCLRGLALALIVTVTATGWAPGPSALAQDQPGAASSAAWHPLGPTGPSQIDRAGVSVDWPADPFLIVGRSQRNLEYSFGRVPTVPPAARSYDGGRTWEPLPTLPPGDLFVLRSERSGRILLAAPSFSPGGSSVDLMRSLDDGLTWVRVWSRNHSDRFPSVIVTPDFVHDERLVVLDDGKATQTFDAGDTWQPLDPVPGQRVHTLVFSPDFAHDRTIYASVTPDRFLGVGGTRDPNESTYHETSAGVMMSTDGGDTWSSVSAGLHLEDGPYRSVQALAISPTFAQDNTLFAYGSGPWIVPDLPNYPRGPVYQLFRSRDRGASWEGVWPEINRVRLARTGTSIRNFMSIALSPRFAEDGDVLTRVCVSTGSPHSGCGDYRSTDGGTTWVSRGGCTADAMDCNLVAVIPTDPLRAAWYTRGGDPGGGLREPDNTSPVAPRLLTYSPYAAQRHTLVADGTVFYPAGLSLWARGPSAVPTEGRVTCERAEAEPYAAARVEAPIARLALGCPTDEPHPLTLRERALADTRLLWPEDASTHWLELTMTQPDAYARRSGVSPETAVRWHDKATNAWSGPPDRVLDAEVQRYEGGLIVRMSGEHGSPVSFVIGGDRWQEVRSP